MIKTIKIIKMILIKFSKVIKLILLTFNSNNNNQIILMPNKLPIIIITLALKVIKINKTLCRIDIMSFRIKKLMMKMNYSK